MLWRRSSSLWAHHWQFMSPTFTPGSLGETLQLNCLRKLGRPMWWYHQNASVSLENFQSFSACMTPGPSLGFCVPAPIFLYVLPLPTCGGSLEGPGDDLGKMWPQEAVTHNKLYRSLHVALRVAWGARCLTQWDCPAATVSRGPTIQ